MKRGVIPAVVALALAAGFGSWLAVATGGGGGGGETSLTLEADNPQVGHAAFRLECDPPGGDVPDAAAACAALARNPKLLTDPKPFVCWGGTSSWWEIAISGRLAGEPVEVRTRTCWTAQMALIRALGIARELERHIDPLSRPAYPGSGIPRSALADVVAIPDGTPGWLIRMARLRARSLGDPRPDRLAVTLGKQHTIALWGDFVCDLCSRPAAAQAPRGHVATLRVDPRTRIVDSFGLHR